MSTFVKICGICSRSDLEQICALEPDAIGFVFWPGSKRYVRPAQVATWLSWIPETVKKVGVFVEPEADEVEAIARECQLDVVQIHMKSNDWKIERPLFDGLEVWLSPRVEEGLTTDVLTAVTPEPSILLADSYDPETVGGTGRPGDWAVATAIKEQLGKPLLLAGGLTSENVSDAIKTVQPWGVDVSSGVESELGKKDLEEAEAFISAVRS